MARFGAVLTAMVTPFDDERRLDVDAAVALARWLVDNGSEGLVLAGTTGEGSTLDDAEKIELWRAVSESVTVPILAGTGSNHTDHTVDLTAAARDAGAAGALVVTPYYSRPSQAGIEAHFRAAAEATDLPVVLYDIPVRSGRKIATETILRLVDEVPNIVAVKDAAGDVAETAALVHRAPPGFEVYCGEDRLALPSLAVGSVGLIGVATHWAGPLYAEMVAAHTAGDVARARAINARLIESATYETSEVAPNPVPTKAMMRVLGHRVGPCRLPLGPEPDGLADAAARVAANLGLAPGSRQSVAGMAT